MSQIHTQIVVAMRIAGICLYCLLQPLNRRVHPAAPLRDGTKQIQGVNNAPMNGQRLPAKPLGLSKLPTLVAFPGLGNQSLCLSVRVHGFMGEIKVAVDAWGGGEDYSRRRRSMPCLKSFLTPLDIKP